MVLITLVQHTGAFFPICLHVFIFEHIKTVPSVSFILNLGLNLEFSFQHSKCEQKHDMSFVSVMH